MISKAVAVFDAMAGARYRHRNGFSDSTDYVEVDTRAKTLLCVLKDGTRRRATIGFAVYELAVQNGEWVRC